jgi:2-oxoglutarate dehydrogenase complex dehydrogenase (E1) component-like enzyme
MKFFIVKDKLDYKNYGFTEADLDKEFYISKVLGVI